MTTYYLCKKHHLQSSTNHQAQTDKQLFTQSITPYELRVKSGTHGHMGISKTSEKYRLVDLLITLDVTSLKEESPTTGVLWHPATPHQTIWCVHLG
jgi:hypothetical protein